MIEVVLTAGKSQICAVSVSGHSGSAERGKDLVCAAVSAIVFGTCNALDELGSSAECIVRDNWIEIRGLGADELTQTIIQTMIIQLKTVQEDNSRFLNIKENGGVKP